MPSFVWKMDDGQIDDTLNYICKSWGSSAKPVDPEHIESLRETFGTDKKPIAVAL